jgi:PAS domain S-box-containing protein
MSAESPRPFRWQALFQRAGEAVFVLDRRRRILFVNAAWERLTGLSADQAHGMLCRRPRPVGADGLLEDVLAHILTPPPEVLGGAFARTRRLFAGRTRAGEAAGSSSSARWWDVEFMPLRQDEPREGYLVVGRIIPLPPDGAGPQVLLPERLMDLRQRRMGSFTFDLLSSGVPAMQRVVAQARLASTVRAPLLLIGEQGTGKETIARIIHYQGPSRERAFAAIDCRRLPASVLAGLLFAQPGSSLWVPGAIYLDDPAGLPRDLQLRLCEWLAVRNASGEPDDGPRFFAGSVRPEEDVGAGRLLVELFSLLGTMTVTLPPLRDRRDDLPTLVEQFLAARSAEQERVVAGLTPAAWEVMRHHDWPGNLDELRQVLADAHGRATAERIDVTELPAALCQTQRLEQEPLRPPVRPVPLEKTLEQVERHLIQLALKRAGGNRGRAAELLGIYRGRLLRRMEALGMVDAEGEAS